jgi:hypothetical protein
MCRDRYECRIEKGEHGWKKSLAISKKSSDGEKKVLKGAKMKSEDENNFLWCLAIIFFEQV